MPLLKGDGGGFNMEGMAAMMTAVAEIASKMQPAEGLAGVASNLLPIVGKLVDTQTALAARRVPAPRMIPAGNPPPVATVPTPPAADVTPKPETPIVGAIVPGWLKPFQTFAGVLVSLADTDADPEVYADVCVDQLTNNEPAFRSAVEAMNAGTLLEDVLSAVPALKETDDRREFAAKLVTRVEEGLREVIAQETEAPANG
jgi:hypothetical protein